MASCGAARAHPAASQHRAGGEGGGGEGVAEHSKKTKNKGTTACTLHTSAVVTVNTYMFHFTCGKNASFYGFSWRFLLFSSA